MQVVQAAYLADLRHCENLANREFGEGNGRCRLCVESAFILKMYDTMPRVC